MKLLVICVLFSLAIADPRYAVRKDLADAWENLYSVHKDECVLESGVDKEDLTNMFSRGHYPDDHRFKCYIKCIAMKYKIMKSDGEFDTTFLKNHVKGADLDITEKILNHSINETDVCQKAYMTLIDGVLRIAKRYPPDNKSN